jgi:uncharacterized protein HemX
MKSDDLKTVFYLALGVGGIYVGWQIYQFLKAARDKAGQAQDAAASTVADAAQALLQTNSGIATPGGTYQVTMADGSVQTVPYGQLPQQPANGLGRIRRRSRGARR